MTGYDKSDLDTRMDKTIDQLRSQFSGLRAGRASPNLVNGIRIDAYGDKMPLSQVAGVSAPEPRLLTITVWDNALIKPVEKAISDSDLGLTPNTEGNVIRLRIPELSEERRKDLVKHAGKFAEQTKIAVRNIRRDGMESVKSSQKASEISEDDARRYGEEIQKLTDQKITLVDKLLSDKEADIMQV